MREGDGIRTSQADEWSLSRVLELKAGQKIAVVIPARNEESTVADIVRIIKEDLSVLLDDVIVMDSLSSDGTVAEALTAGARVFSVADVRPDLGVQAGKGEALWKSLFVTDADLLVFIDADLTEWGSHFVTGLLGPMLADPEVMLVRGFYDRVMNVGESTSLEGGRVTELVARPWLALNRPELAGVVQPLAGEWAIRRSVFEQFSVPVHYGVELSTLLDVHKVYGSRAITQVDLGRRAHRHQSLHDLGAMALELLVVGDRRRDGHGMDDPGATVELRAPLPDRAWSIRAVHVGERPPHRTVT